MTVLVFLIFCGFAVRSKGNKKLYIFLCVLAFTLLASLRHECVGVDTHTYAWKYYAAWQKDFSEVWSEKEALFFTLQTFFSQNSLSFNQFLFVNALLFYPVIGVFVYKYSKIPAISFLLFLSMGYFYFSMTGMRQTLGLGFLIISLMYTIRGRYLKASIFIGIASLCHITSLIYFLTIPVALIPPKKLKYYIMVLLAGIVVIILYTGRILAYFAELIWEDGRYTEINPQGGSTTLFMLIAIAVFCYVCFRKDFHTAHQNDTNFQLYKIMLLSIPLQTLTLFAADAFRLAMLFHITSIVVMPNAVASIKNNSTKLTCEIVITILLLIEYYMFTRGGAGIEPYHFFWEDGWR